MNKKSFLVILLCLVLFTLASCNLGHVHTYGEWVTTKEATCLEVGIKQRICECGYAEVDFINKTAHIEVIDDAVLATCEEDGLSVGKHCSICSTVLEEQGVIPATGHSYNNEVWDYVKEDGHAHKCLKCGDYDMHDHTSNGAATENNSEICNDCGYVISPATGHINHVQSTNLSYNDKHHWYYCTGCNAVKYDVSEHNFGEYMLDTVPTTSSEGLLIAVCADCQYNSVLKIMKTPFLIKNGYKLSWDNVPAATGYYLYNGNELIADLGDVRNYAVSSLELADVELNIVAYTDNSSYKAVSECSNSVLLNMSEINLQADLGTDFEGYDPVTNANIFDGVSTSPSGSTKGTFYKDSLGRAVVGLQNGYHGNRLFEEKDGNIALKMYGTSDSSGITRAGIDVSEDLLKAGTYKASIKLKLGPNANDIRSLLFKFHDKGRANGMKDGNKVYDDGFYFCNYKAGEKVTLSKEEWTTLEITYILPQDITGVSDLYIVFIAYTMNYELKDPQNYLLVDDLEVYKISDSTEAPEVDDPNKINEELIDFESYAGLSDLFTTSGTLSSGWKDDNNGKKLVGIQAGYQAVKLFDDNGNVALKMYGGKEVVRAGIDIDDSFAYAGTYKVSIKVKLGPSADKVGSILFRFHDKSSLLAENSLVKTGFYFKDPDEDVGLSKSEWVTLDVEVKLDSNINYSSDLCIVLMVYTYGNTTSGTDGHSTNYVLVDDLQIVRIN